MPWEEVALAQAFEPEAQMNVLERKAVVRKAEVLVELKRLRTKTPEAIVLRIGRR